MAQKSKNCTPFPLHLVTSIVVCVALLLKGTFYVTSSYMPRLCVMEITLNILSVSNPLLFLCSGHMRLGGKAIHINIRVSIIRTKRRICVIKPMKFKWRQIFEKWREGKTFVILTRKVSNIPFKGIHK